MKIGTKSVLYGGHQFLIHPWFVAWAWWKLYGFPWKIQYWVAFFVHDFGYWGKPNMDGPEGETHVEFGANVMELLFGKEWGDFCRYHSRFYAKKDNKPFSRLCVADKLAICLEPRWFYMFRVLLSGEVYEYLAKAGGMAGSKYNGEPEVSGGKYVSMNLVSNDPALTDRERLIHWHSRMTDYLERWVAEHQDGREDTWTPGG